MVAVNLGGFDAEYVCTSVELAIGFIFKTEVAAEFGDEVLSGLNVALPLQF